MAATPPSLRSEVVTVTRRTSIFIGSSSVQLRTLVMGVARSRSNGTVFSIPSSSTEHPPQSVMWRWEKIVWYTNFVSQFRALISILLCRLHPGTLFCPSRSSQACSSTTSPPSSTRSVGSVESRSSKARPCSHTWRLPIRLKVFAAGPATPFSSPAGSWKPTPVAAVVLRMATNQQ